MQLFDQEDLIFLINFFFFLTFGHGRAGATPDGGSRRGAALRAPADSATVPLCPRH
jgi:hypothetical protein